MSVVETQKEVRGDAQRVPRQQEVGQVPEERREVADGTNAVDPAHAQSKRGENGQ